MTTQTVVEKTKLKHLWDFIGIPFRFLLFDQAWLPRFGWTTLEAERLKAIHPYLRGRLLDIGAGTNNLVREYGNGVGVDVHDWGGGALVVENTAQLSFPDRSFDTVTFVACLNHIPYREDVLKEARRLIRPGGQLIVTMINPVIGTVGHALWWHSEDKHRGGMKEGEVGGIWSRDITCLCESKGFQLQLHKRFLYGMNHLYLFVTS